MKNFGSLLATCLILPASGEFTIDPTLHINVVGGLSSADNPGDVASHEHDPNDDFALQGVDLGLNLRSDWVQGFANINAFTVPGGELETEWEEGFLKFHDLPGGFEIRAGRYLNRFGLQNNIHLHGWDYVNSNLSTSQFLGEEGLTTEGVELTWSKEFDQTLFAITGSYGKAAGHHEEEEEEEEGEEEHNESLENAFFSDEVLTARALIRFNDTDFRQHQIGLNGGWGENGYGRGRDTALYSLDYQFTWRENGLESGGREFAVGAEYFYRDVDWTHPENSANQGSSSQQGFMAFARYRFAEKWIADLRYEHIEGEQAGPELDTGEIEYAFDVEERDRISLALTHEFQLSKFDSYGRLQYDHDEFEDSSEDTVWLQFGFNYGPGEVR